MRSEMFETEAAECRRRAATEFAGRPEEPLLLRLARVFEELDSEDGAPDRGSTEGCRSEAY
jgi:hypothetical protein